MFEISEHCYACQKRHLKEVKKSSWEVKCNYIPKVLWDEGYFPLEEVVPDEEYKSLNIIEKTKLQYKFNKLLWAKHKLGWSVYNPKRKQDQYWQKATLLCTAKSKACRFGRRLGKTEILCIDALHFCDTTEIKNANVMIVVPYQNLLEEIFDRLKSMLNSDDSAFKDSFRSTKKPFSITFSNGTKILGFTAGSGSGSEGASTRGQRCDKLFLDECDYLKTGDIETVMALKMEHSNFEVQVTSTPSAIPGKFREMCLVAPDFKDFHYPSTVLSSYQDQEKELKRMYNKDGFSREVLAEFYENNSKVFPTDEIRASFTSFKYITSFAEQAVPQEWVYSIGEI